MFDFLMDMATLAGVLALAGWGSGCLVSRFRLEAGGLIILALVARWGVAQMTGVALVLAVVSGVPAAAQTVCAGRGVLVRDLEARYGERFAGGGLRSARQIVEVWFSEEKGTWTILMTRADGKSCIMASGTNWRAGAAVGGPKGVPG